MQPLIQIFIAPAKKMQALDDSPAPAALPRFNEEAKALARALSKLSLTELMQLYKCSASIAAQNFERLQHFKADNLALLTPALFAYQGIQYQYMSARVLTSTDYAYLQQHLFILSGLYGLLRPMDGVSPYRLEMQAKFAFEGAQDLYAFWQDKVRTALCQLQQETGRELVLLDLASAEYSRVLPSDFTTIKVRFCVESKGKLVERGTLCKMARGAMVQYLARSQAESLEVLPHFAGLDFKYSPEHSSAELYTFIQQPQRAKQD